MKTITMVITLAMTLAFAAVSATTMAADTSAASKPVRVVLIGASIGENWNLPGLPVRTQTTGYEFEALQAWQYDKSEVLDETLIRPKRKFHLTSSYLKGFFAVSPEKADVILLKECSSYFPGDAAIERKREMVDRWVHEVRAKNIKVMLATVVPVTKQRAAKDVGKQEALHAFNDWVRDYARKNDIVLLDFEVALRTDQRERYLRDEFTSGDGSHLNRKAYDILDQIMIQALHKLEMADKRAAVETQAK